ncbi:nitroreductase family deazaflavin-dependent oxidoreductase [Geodermatophilus sp. SYSU D01186]
MRSPLALLAGRLLRRRLFVRAPIVLYRLCLGRVLGRRLLMVEHTGRTSGRRLRVVLECLLRPASGQVVVASGFGRQAQWYRNLEVNPAVQVSSGGLRRRPARAELLNEEQSDALLRQYARKHPAALRRLVDAIAAARPGQDVDIRLVRLHLTPGAG